MKDKLIRILDKYGSLFVLFCIIVMVAGLIISYVRPNKVLDTYEINMAENNDYNIVLEPGTLVEYYCNTGERAMTGIQVGISKEGHEYTDGKVVCQLFKSDDNTLLGTVQQNLNEIVELQYVYFTFMNMTEYAGDIVVKFSYEGSDAEFPAIVANDTLVKDTKTVVNDIEQKGSLKSYYIYSHSTYPLVLDLKVFLAVFITIFFTLDFGNKKKKKAELPL